MAEQQTPGRRLLGDFAPKIVQLTDDVLFGDVWKRPAYPPATAAWLPSPSWPQPTGPTSSSATSPLGNGFPDRWDYQHHVHAHAVAAFVSDLDRLFRHP